MSKELSKYSQEQHRNIYDRNYPSEVKLKNGPYRLGMNKLQIYISTNC